MFDISSMTSELNKMKEDKLAAPLNANDVIEFTEEDLKSFENMVTKTWYAYNAHHLGKDLISIL